ncbi:hypothetical protein ACRAVF_20185 [Bradyrhizobium oligotrophicum S58]
MLDRFIGREMKPALPALVRRPAVPSDRQGLNAPVGKDDQILLQRIDTERIFDFEHGKLAIGTVGLDQELAVLSKEA